MSKLPTFLSAFDKLLTGHPVYFTNSLLVVLSAGGEKFFQSVAFKCPKDRAVAPWYGWLFLIAPLFVLLVCGMVLNENLWRVYHGYRKRSKGTELRRGHRCRSFWFTFFRSLIVPSAWLFVSLLDGTYIICSLAEEPEKETEETLRIKAFSQMVGWGYLVVVVIVGSAVTCCMRCNDKKTFLELRYVEVYKKLEKGELEKKMNEKAQKIAKENVNSLFSEDLPPKRTWDEVTLPNDSKVSYYTPLHKWSDQAKRKEDSTENIESGEKQSSDPSSLRKAEGIKNGSSACKQLSDGGTKNSTQQEKDGAQKGIMDSTQC
ncbi:calcium homeostasis modulator protein 6-like [Argiope bruennichi]|uniref:calcium homeostasis modulator protein 6-like n=1 Tax=Argiope bruennichi TaxID=94029 RepID=UPI0024940BAD|nr:calcium homeostasis modulator protein 6-like [Argiope bruennichi]